MTRIAWLLGCTRHKFVCCLFNACYCTGAMLPPAPRAPKHARGHASRGIPLLPAGMQAQCQARQLDRAMAKCIAGQTSCYLMNLSIGASLLSLLTIWPFAPLLLLANTLQAISDCSQMGLISDARTPSVAAWCSPHMVSLTRPVHAACRS